ncbi:MAG: helix-turn-helix domain-containing protein, partial [Patescibacteria group bacterium]
GKLPNKEDLTKTKPISERVKKENTYAETKELMTKSFNLEQIASARKLTVSTIVGHIETLAENNELSANDLRNLLQISDNWKEMKKELFSVFVKDGMEKLKPVYEATKGKYDYHSIRLTRLLYNLDK